MVGVSVKRTTSRERERERESERGREEGIYIEREDGRGNERGGGRGRVVQVMTPKPPSRMALIVSYDFTPRIMCSLSDTRTPRVSHTFTHTHTHILSTCVCVRVVQCNGPCPSHAVSVCVCARRWGIWRIGCIAMHASTRMHRDGCILTDDGRPGGLNETGAGEREVAGGGGRVRGSKGEER